MYPIYGCKPLTCASITRRRGEVFWRLQLRNPIGHGSSKKELNLFATQNQQKKKEKGTGSEGLELTAS
jgi:hypothetical protein